MLDHLLNLPSGLKEQIEQEIHRNMHTMALRKTHADTSFSVTFCYLMERYRKEKNLQTEQMGLVDESLSEEDVKMLRFDLHDEITQERLPNMLKVGARDSSVKPGEPVMGFTTTRSLRVPLRPTGRCNRRRCECEAHYCL